MQSLRALRSRNYRLFFLGQGISLIGTWMTRIATSWLVYRLSGSAFLLGLVGFAGQIPTFLLTPFAGVMADRWNRRRLLVLTQLLAMAGSFALAFLAVSGVITVMQIIALSIFQGIVNALDIPARQAFVIEMVEDENDVGNAIALNSSIFNGARLLGPSIAGVIIAGAGEWLCFLIDGVSYIAVIAALYAMRIAPKSSSPKRQNILQQLRDGIGYAYSFVPIRTVLLLVALVSLMGMPYALLMPVFAREVLHSGAHTYGFLMAASGLGALAGGIYLAFRRSVIGLDRIIVISTGIFGVGLILFGFSRVLWLSLLLMLATGFGMLVQMAACNTVLQTIVDDDKRGRIISFYAMAFMGMMPLGSLLAGIAATHLGAPNTLMIGGIVCVASALAFARQLSDLRQLVRPIYLRKGIIPEVASGMQVAVQLTLPPED